MRLQIKMTAERVALLIRSALIEDAKNVNERIAAIMADISVEDDAIWVTLDDDLWPDAKRATNTEAFANMLLMDIEWCATSGTFPFAWPGLGEATNSTNEYFGMVLDAHAGRDLKPK